MFGTRIVELRKNKGLTQAELATSLGISRSALSLYEIEKREPDITTLKKIASLFGVSSDYLLGLSDKHFPEEDLEWRYPHIENMLGKKISSYRSKNGISEATFADKLKIDIELLANIEMGVYTPSYSLLKKIAEITHYDIDYLTGAVSSTSVHTGSFKVGEQIIYESEFESNQYFQARLEEYCMYEGITDENVSERLGLSKKDYLEIKYSRMPTLSELLRISYGLGVSLDFLIGKTDIPNINLTSEELALLTNYRECAPPYKKNISDRAEKLSIESVPNPLTVAAVEEGRKVSGK